MELLAPAGTLEKLKWAVIYGADAVYFGMEFGSLRNFAGNFTFDDAAKGLEFLHDRGKKGYVTLNIYPFSDEYDLIIDTAKTMDDMGADAFIVSDLGVFRELKRLDLHAPVHISTQANTTSYQAVLAYLELGAKRVNLARELSLERIKEILAKTRGLVETEVFIHGAVCFSYSGRCAISDYLTGHGANRGECKHPCRWRYFLMEETRPGRYMPVFEDERGLYLFNSKDLALFEFIPALKEAGVASIKIEGRMKTIHYIATVVSFYRQVLDGKMFSPEEALKLLNRIPNRGFSTGFMKGAILPDDYDFNIADSTSDTILVGNITEERINSKCVIRIRNNISAGETLETLSPDGGISSVTMPQILVTTDGNQVKCANNSQYLLFDQELKPYTILRRVAGKGLA
ncbi:MAG: U32 family peptidase [Deltaproteobacteria bacterium]|nr:U32 family peptidase [Deltaproteobacteria bacterium]